MSQGRRALVGGRSQMSIRCLRRFGSAFVTAGLWHPVDKVVLHSNFVRVGSCVTSIAGPPRRCATVLEMKEDPSVRRSGRRSQATASCCGQKRKSARREAGKAGRAARRFKDFQWTTLDSWSRKLPCPEPASAIAHKTA
jgi:hypothetical protein